MRVTKDTLLQKISALNEYGANIALCSRNGYYAIDSNDKKRNFFCGSMRETYYYLQGLCAAMYGDITFNS